MAFENTKSMLQRLIFILTLALGSQAFANACYSHFPPSEAVRKLVVAEAYQQWRLWEQLANYSKFIKNTAAVNVGLVPVPLESVDIQLVSSLPAEIRDLFLKADHVSWPQHPFNKSPDVPYFYLKPIEFLKAFFTASRSMDIADMIGAYTFKVGTGHPHGPKQDAQEDKISTKEDIQKALNRTRYIESVDARIGRDPKLIIAKDILSIADKKTGEGVLVRDNSYLKDGHYYLPASSLPFVGRQIAELSGEVHTLFWEKHYSMALGRAKAKLLLRYGLQMRTPNPQNILIQLDRDLKPTGAIVFRDLGDSVLSRDILLAYNERQAISWEGQVHGIGLLDKADNSHDYFSLAGEYAIPKLVIAYWMSAHNEAFKNEIELTLQDKVPKVTGYTIVDTQNFIFSPAGLNKMKEYRRLLLQEHSTQNP